MHEEKETVKDKNTKKRWNVDSPKTVTGPPTSEEDLIAPEVEDLPSTLPLLQGRRQLRRRDVEVDRQQRDADQADMKPPLSHIELSGGVVSFLPASKEKVTPADVLVEVG